MRGTKGSALSLFVWVCAKAGGGGREQATGSRVPTDSRAPRHFGRDTTLTCTRWRRPPDRQDGALSLRLPLVLPRVQRGQQAAQERLELPVREGVAPEARPVLHQLCEQITVVRMGLELRWAAGERRGRDGGGGTSEFS